MERGASRPSGPVYKLLRREEYERLRADGTFGGSPADRADGFIHLSTASQVRETAAKHFAGVDRLVLAAIDPARLPRPLAWEPSRGGALFPHLYAPLPVFAVASTWVLPLGPDGRHVFPELE